MVDSGQSVPERMDLVELGAEANRAQHVQALDHHRHLRIRCVVPCVEADEVLIVVLDIDAGESDDGIRRICGCLGCGRNHDGQYTRIECGGDGGGDNAADPNFGCRGIGADRLQGRGSIGGECGRTRTGFVRCEHDEWRWCLRADGLLSARNGVVRNEYHNEGANRREPNPAQLGEWLEAALHLTTSSLEYEISDLTVQNSSMGESTLLRLDLSD